MTLAEFLANLKRLGQKNGTRNHIATADRYLTTLAKCTGGLCPTDRARYQGPEFEKRVKEAAGTAVYRNDFMNFLGFSKAPKAEPAPETGLKALATFDAVYTSLKQDRDSDVLHPEGCEVDPKMPLLWQHDPTQPIGRHDKVLSQDKVKILGTCSIADIPLGNDAAYLAEFGALRLSHGFRPKEFQPITEKSGRDEMVVGFDVTKYEMMEISLVSVPSNTDAMIEEFQRNKMVKSITKSIDKALDERRQRFFVTGFGAPAMKSKLTVVSVKRCGATGKVKPLVARKDAAGFEKDLADACGKIVHSGDYGMCFYKAGDNPDTYSVWWTAGDADDPGNTNEEGVNYTSPDDIKALLTAVTGVANVDIEAEGNPPYDEGWREVYPEVRDWVSDADGSKPQPAAPSDAPPLSSGSDNGSNDGGNTGKGAKGKKKGTKADAPVSGSAEHVSSTLSDAAQDFLTQNNIEVGDKETVKVEATYPEYVILCVGMEDGSGPVRYYQVPYSTDDAGSATFSGSPMEVELQTVVTDAPAADKPDAPDPNATAPNPADATPTPGDPVRSAKPAKKGKPKWVPKKPTTKGKVGKKDMGMLKEAVDHISDAMSREGMPTVCKTLCRRGVELVGDVIKSDGAPDPSDTDGGKPPAMDDQQRNLWAMLVKMVRSGKSSKTAIAAIMTELALSLEGSDVAKLLDSLNKPAG